MKTFQSRLIALLLVYICISCIGLFVSFQSKKRSIEQHTKSSKPLCKDCNIILVTMDVCSARNIPCYGYERNTTPNLCAYAKENQLFLNAFANAPWTFPSHASIMTGLLPSHHKVYEQYRDTLSPSIPLLNEELQKNGYETIFFQYKTSDVMPLDTVYNRGVSDVEENFQIDRIFSRIDESRNRGKKTFISYYMSKCHEPNRVGVENKLFTTDSYPNIPIDRDDNMIHFTPEFFAYLKKKLPERLELNAYNAKTPHIKKTFDRMLGASSFEVAKSIFLNDSIISAPEIITNMFWSHIYDTYIDVNDKRQMTYLRALYDQHLFEQDANEISGIVEKLKMPEYKNDTILLITSQHGQEFGEHGVFGHTTLYEGNSRVPFVLSVPGVAPHVISEPISGVDIMPTLLDLVGVVEPYSFDGMSITPLFSGGKLPKRLIIADQKSGNSHTLTVRKGNWKVFLREDGGSLVPYELYNTEVDPNELNDVLTSRMDIANALIQEYKQQYILKK